MLYIFPDTNIFIHGKDFETINWAKWLETKEFTLVITPTVIAELDKHKYNASKRISKRVKTILPRLEEIIENTLVGKIAVKLISNKPKADTFDKYSLEVKEQDDAMLASIIEFKDMIGKNDTIVLISNDTGPRLKAKSLSIPVLKLPEELLQPSELDDTEKQIKILQKELIELKTKAPILSVTFPDGTGFISIKRLPQLMSVEEFVENEMTKIKLENPPLYFNDSEKIPQPGRILFGNRNDGTLRKEQVEQYNRELVKYFKKCPSYLATEYRAVVEVRNIVILSLIVPNKGLIPAKDIDIHFNFPTGFDIKASVPKLKERPGPPEKPKSGDFVMRDIRSQFSRGSGFDIDPAVLEKLNSNVSSPDITKTDGHEVRFTIKGIKHNQHANLDTLYLKFPDIDKASGFSFRYKIFAANISNLIEGSLNINLVDAEDEEG